MSRYLKLGVTITLAIVLGMRIGLAAWSHLLPRFRCQLADSFHGFDLVCLVKLNEVARR